MKKTGLKTTPYDKLTYQIIGCAMAVHRKLEPGYREDTYQRDLATHLAESRLEFEEQKPFEVHDTAGSGGLIGYYIPDFVVEGKVILEIKALSGLDNSHVAQVIGYLVLTGCPIGLLINFGERSLKYRRIFPPDKVKDFQVNRQWLFVPDWLKPEEES